MKKFAEKALRQLATEDLLFAHHGSVHARPEAYEKLAELVTAEVAKAVDKERVRSPSQSRTLEAKHHPPNDSSSKQNEPIKKARLHHRALGTFPLPDVQRPRSCIHTLSKICSSLCNATKSVSSVAMECVH